jgi:hypothetical protein
MRLTGFPQKLPGPSGPVRISLAHTDFLALFRDLKKKPPDDKSGGSG